MGEALRSAPRHCLQPLKWAVVLDLTLTGPCANPALDGRNRRTLVAKASSANPPEVSVSSGNRTIMAEAPQTVEVAVPLVRLFIGVAITRVGIPVGRDLRRHPNTKLSCSSHAGYMHATGLFGRDCPLSRRSRRRHVRRSRKLGKRVFDKYHRSPGLVLDVSEGPPHGAIDVRDSGAADSKEAGNRVDLAGLADWPLLPQRAEVTKKHQG